VAELADAHGSGPCTRKGVGVRVPSSAPGFQKPPIKMDVFSGHGGRPTALLPLLADGCILRRKDLIAKIKDSRRILP
jgi:hypothetical protein